MQSTDYDISVYIVYIIVVRTLSSSFCKYKSDGNIPVLCKFVYICHHYY